MGKSVAITIKLADRQAYHFAQFVKRACRVNIGPSPNGKDLVTRDELPDAEEALMKLRDALAAVGHEPR